MQFAARTTLALALLATPVLATPVSAAGHDTLTIGAAQFPQGMHPNLTGQDILTYAAGFALKRVTTFDSNGQIVCLLCTAVPTLENGLAKREGDGLAVTIKLRPGLFWGDGAPVTARDIAYTWRVAGSPGVGFLATHPWNRATSVDVVDDQTAVLHLDHTYTNFPLWDEVLSEHADGPALDGGDYVNHTPYNRDPANAGLWDGPYIVSAYRVNQSVDYIPNPHWPGIGPGFKHLSLRLVENTAALQANLLSGDVDMTPSGTGLTIDQAVALEKSTGDRFRFLYRPQLSYEHIEPRLDNPILANREVREALLRAIDVPAIVGKLFGGHAEVARSFINGLDPHYTPDVPTYPYDPARARALLEQAGWKPGPDGIRRNAAGDRLSLDFATTAGNRVRELTQQVMQSQWRAVGVDVVIHNQPSRTFFGQLLKHREFEGMAEYASTLEPLLVPWLRLSSPFIPSEANGWGGQNYAGIADKQLDALIAAAQYELDPAKEQALWTQMQRIYATNLYHLPLYFRADPDIIPRWMQGYVATGKETYVSFFAENWHP